MLPAFTLKKIKIKIKKAKGLTTENDIPLLVLLAITWDANRVYSKWSSLWLNEIYIRPLLSGKNGGNFWVTLLHCLAAEQMSYEKKSQFSVNGSELLS